MKEEPQVLTLPGISADQAWTPQEQWVWERVQAGAIADFNTREGYGRQPAPKGSDNWPATRRLRPIFLETVLLHEGLDNLLGLISTGDSRRTKSDHCGTDSALKPLSPCP